MMNVSILFVLVSLYAGHSWAAQSEDKRFCKDELSFQDCQFYKTLGVCNAKEYFPVLSQRCPLTCNLCTFGLKRKPAACNDKDTPSNCAYLKKHGACQSHSDIMAVKCARTCKLCDAKHKCAAKKCKFNEVCVLDEKRDAQCICPKYCPNKNDYAKLGKVCGSDGKTYKDYCHLRHHSCRDNNNITVTKYGLCDSDIPCEDRKLEKEQGMCDTWKNMGFCDADYYERIMKKYCKRTCGHCNHGKVPVQMLRGDCDNNKLSPFGCCFDLTFAPDPKSGKKCPSCRDDYSFCSSFVQQCNNPSNTVFMKKRCPLTCGFCTPNKKPILQLKIFNSNGKQIYKIEEMNNE